MTRPLATLFFVVPGTREDSFGLMNIRAGLTVMEGKLTIHGYMDNVFDKEYIIDGGNTGGSFGIPTFIAGPPRHVRPRAFLQVLDPHLKGALMSPFTLYLMPH